MQESIKIVCRISAVAALTACLSACSTSPLVCQHTMPSQSAINKVKAPASLPSTKDHQAKHITIPQVTHHHILIHHHVIHPVHHFLPSPPLPQRADAALFVVSSQLGKIEQLNSVHHYNISLPVNQIEQVMMYTQKPAHSVSYISGASLDQVWKQAHQNFQSSNPHAVLTASGMASRVVRIHGEQLNNGAIIYEITSSKALPSNSLQHINLTIDKY